MHVANFPPLLSVFWDTQIVRWGVWVGLVVLTVALLLLIRTRWGQSQPLGKCIVLSLLAHLLLAIYTTTVTIVTATVGSPDGKGVQVALVDGSSGGDAAPLDEAAPEARDPTIDGGSEAFDAGVNLPQPVTQPDAAALPEVPDAERQLPPVLPQESEKQPTPSEEAAAPSFETFEPIVKSTPKPQQIDIPEPVDVDALDPVPPPEPAPPGPPAPAANGATSDAKANGSKTSSARTEKSTGTASTGATGASLAGPQPGVGPKTLPGVLKGRGGDHLQAAKGLGATQASEAAVTAALKWLAANQSGSGRWDTRRLGGGAAVAADGEQRPGAGAQADTGITGLALLAFLAAGHTHLQGPHQSTVRRGLEYLMSVQDTQGCLGATPNQYERMYCHAMATCALSEAFAMTRDPRLQPAVQRAIGYTVRAQDRVTGGWRYFPGTAGDTSQLGWQVMALKSADLAGIAIAPQTRDGIDRFLRSVAAGTRGGLARYQSDRGTVSRAMTAEALVCRQFVGIVDPVKNNEAVAYVLQELPGTSKTNIYYWYYATLGLHQAQGPAWQSWNDALQKNLIATQRHDGELSGSWDPDPVWGGIGGRGYSTALSTLCLEVYYRFLPLHVESAGAERRTQ